MLQGAQGWEILHYLSCGLFFFPSSLDPPPPFFFLFHVFQPGVISKLLNAKHVWNITAYRPYRGRVFFFPPCNFHALTYSRREASCQISVSQTTRLLQSLDNACHGCCTAVFFFFFWRGGGDPTKYLCWRRNTECIRLAAKQIGELKPFISFISKISIASSFFFSYATSNSVKYRT